MGKFDELKRARRADEEQEQYEDIEMSLACGTCQERSSKARRAIGSGIIGWKCPNGHKNLMEDFHF